MANSAADFCPDSCPKSIKFPAPLRSPMSKGPGTYARRGYDYRIIQTINSNEVFWLYKNQVQKTFYILFNRGGSANRTKHHR